MRKIGAILSVLLGASLAPCVAGTVTNAYYRAELETADGVARLAGLVKVQKGGDVSVPGTWTVPGGAAAVAFENGRIVVKGKLVFDAGGAASCGSILRGRACRPSLIRRSSRSTAGTS